MTKLLFSDPQMANSSVPEYKVKNNTKCVTVHILHYTVYTVGARII